MQTKEMIECIHLSFQLIIFVAVVAAAVHATCFVQTTWNSKTTRAQRSTSNPNNIIEIQAFPESNDVVGLRDLYLQLDISKSKINMIKDVISSGDEISGTVFTRDFYTSSYSNGKLIRE